MLLAVLARNGGLVEAVRRFATDAAGVAATGQFLESLEDGTIVAIAARSVAPPPTDPDGTALREVLALVGGVGRTDDRQPHRYALLGARGAPVGSALEQHALSRAAVRAGPPTARLPILAVRGWNP